MVVQSKLTDKLLGKRTLAVTFFPFMFLRTNVADRGTIINHERIHLRQQLELLVLFFYVWYAVEFVVRLVMYRNADKAYSRICFEMEAYECEGDKEYLKRRKLLGFVRYL